MQQVMLWLSKIFFLTGALLGTAMMIVSLTRSDKIKNKMETLVDDLILLAIAITCMLIGIGLKQDLLPL